MKRNRVTEMLRRECPKCGAFSARGDRECPKCGASLVQLQWISEEIVSEDQETQINEANKDLATSYADRSPEIVSGVFPGLVLPPKESVMTDWDAYWDFRKKAATGPLICLVVLLGIYFVIRGADENPWLWGTLLVLLIAVIPITWYVLNNRKEKASVQPKTKSECRALIVSVGGLVVQHKQQYRTMKVLADIDGGTCVQVYVNYVPDNMCETFYPVGREITLVSDKDGYTAVLESLE
ncbi:MAG: DUF1772 domain-containing protein [Lachnospiraceae bacterium]|nr:DUF1772 domain-containing protein [Lachnospiraceae bacterium]